MTFDIVKLGLMMKARRGYIPLRVIEKEVEVSAGTLSRMERAEGQPTIDTLLRVMEWLDVPLSTFIVEEALPVPKKDKVFIVIESDRDLSTEAFNNIARVFRKTTGGYLFFRAMGPLDSIRMLLKRMT